MNIRNTLDRIKHSRIAKEKSQHETKEHEEMAQKYEKKKKFHEATKKPKSESLKEKAIKAIMTKGKDIADKSKKHAIEELKKSKKSKSKSKTKKSEPKRKSDNSQSNFSFGFDNNQNNQQFGFGFNPQQTAAKPEKEVDWSQIYNFRWNTESPKKKKKDSNELWDFRGFWQ